MAKTVQMIFKAKNDRGESLIEVAAKQGEIWTARANLPRNYKNWELEKGDRILLKRSGRGKVEYEGIVEFIQGRTTRMGDAGISYRWGNWRHCKKAGFSTPRKWQRKYAELNGLNPNLSEPLEWFWCYFIHITDIKPYVKPRASGQRRSNGN